MLTLLEQRQAKDFIGVLKREALIFNAELEINIDESQVTVKCSNYECKLVQENRECFLENNQPKSPYLQVEQDGRFKEDDFFNGLVRLRFELIRFLNPDAF